LKQNKEKGGLFGWGGFKLWKRFEMNLFLVVETKQVISSENIEPNNLR
jgi:hypothetical protein